MLIGLKTKCLFDESKSFISTSGFSCFSVSSLGKCFKQRRDSRVDSIAFKYPFIPKA